MANGNGIPRWVGTALITMLWGALCGVMLFMGNSVRANEDKAQAAHVSIRKEVQVKDTELRKELMQEIKLVQLEQKVMRKDMSEGFTNVLVAIAEIKK